MSDGWPKILSRQVTRLSPWTALIERDVEFAPGGGAATYHSVQQSDYIAIVALTADRQIPIVRQFRPAVEAFTWELPAGLVETDEDPAVTCCRELLEETGFPAQAVQPLGTAAPCTGRLSNRIHNFFVKTGDRVPDFVPEPGLSVKLVAAPELVHLIATGEFSSQLHLGALLLAELHLLLKLT